MPKPSLKVDAREREICARIKAFRQSIQWPQTAMAYELGITLDQYTGIEYARSPLRFSEAARFCLLFDVNEYWLATGIGPHAPYGASLREIPPAELEGYFSEVFDRHCKEAAKTASTVNVSTKAKASAERFDIPPGFDPHHHLMTSVLSWLGPEIGLSDLEKARLAFEVASIGNTLAYRYKRERIKQRVRHSESVRAKRSPKA